MKKSVIALLLACALGGGSFAGTASAQSQSAKEKAAARDKESAKAWVELYPEIEKAIQARLSAIRIIRFSNTAKI